MGIDGWNCQQAGIAAGRWTSSLCSSATAFHRAVYAQGMALLLILVLYDTMHTQASGRLDLGISLTLQYYRTVFHRDGQVVNKFHFWLFRVSLFLCRVACHIEITEISMDRLITAQSIPRCYASLSSRRGQTQVYCVWRVDRTRTNGWSQRPLCLHVQHHVSRTRQHTWH